MLTPRAATWPDIAYLQDNLRPADVAECVAAGGSPAGALRNGMLHSRQAWVGENEEGLPVCIGGVVPSLDPMVGYVWALATPEVEQHRMSFLRRGREWVDRWNLEFPVLTNAVDERNALHIRWLRWLGFTFIRRIPRFGVEERPFLEFVRLSPCANPYP